MRKIDLGLDSFRLSAARTGGLPCGAVAIAAALKMDANLLGFIFFERTGVCLLLGDTDFFQHIEDRFTFNFQLPGQVVNSNLTHPPVISSAPFR